jgi:hypothetical protein
MSETWHADLDLARAYADGRTDPVLTASLEQHVIGCGRCRGLLGTLAPHDSLDHNWRQVLERVQTPRPRPLERLLTRLGIDGGTARLLALTPALRGAWLSGLALVLCLAVVVAYADPHGVSAFLAVAPLLPALGVAFAFGPAADPTHEVAAAAPYPFLRLLAVRTALVVSSTLVPAALAGALLPGSLWLAAAWLLPGLALAAATLAVGAHVPPPVAVTGLGICWVAVAGRSLLPHENPLFVTEPAVQLVCAVLLAACAVALLRERDRLPELIRRVS